MKNKNLALFLIFIAAFLSGGIGAMVKIGLRDIPPFSFTFLRFFIAVIFILPFFLKEKNKIKIDGEMIKVSLFLSINVLLYIIGIQWTLVNISQMLTVSIPIMVSIISYFLLKERITNKKIIGIVIGLIGSLLLISMRFVTKLDFGKMVLGNLTVSAGYIFYSFYLVSSKNLQKKYSPVYITTILNLVVLIVSFFLAMSDLYFHPNWWIHFSYLSLLSVIYLGLVATTIVFFLLQTAIQLGTPLITSMGLYLQLFFTFIWSYFLLGEKLTGNFLISGSLIFIGAWLVSYSKD